MSFVALEKFNKQFENGGKRTVSELLRLEKEGRFAFYMPDADDVDADMLADRVGKCLPNIWRDRFLPLCGAEKRI